MLSHAGARALRLIAPVALLAAGCGERAGETGADGLSRETFVATYIDLRQATAAGALDDATRDSILALHGVTEAELRGWVDQRATNPAELSEAWREVMDSLAARDSAGRSDTLEANP